MKYPQLVSSRAVNEISDWLIRRLEDLDIEQPSVYSRLLLSLLHTPFKVNAIDLLEIPQLKELKQPYRFLNKDNEELKRLAAVESLMEVSAKQNKSNIIHLVDELHSKLRKIETSCEENQIAGRASSVASTGDPVTSINSKLYKNLKKIKRNHENPTKNYYLAFPALSSKKTNTTITYGGVKMPSSVEVAESKKDSANLQLLCWSSLMSKDNSNPAAAECQNADKSCDVKMKTPRKKRRYGRLQSLKGVNNSDVQCYAKTKDANSEIIPPKPKSGNSKKHQRNQLVTSKHQAKACSTTRNSNYSNADCSKMVLSSNLPAPWDMDFKGQWTMDRDLIGEFIEQQHDIFSKNSSNDRKSNILVKEENENVLMKFLPITLTDEGGNNVNLSFDKKFGENLQKTDETQSISSLKSKFDANVKALWNDMDEPLTKPLLQRSFDYGDNSLLTTSYVSEKNSFSLFNFNGYKHESEEITADTALQMYNSYATDFDCNNNNLKCQGVINKSLPSGAISPGAEEKFIRSGTNLQASIWSNDEFAREPEYKRVGDYDDAIYKKMKSIGAEMKNWQMSAQDDEGAVSLFNHSVMSAFKRVRPPIASTIIRANYHPLNTPQIELPFVDLPEDADNLLTSELTHFSPIIRDGHTFVIDNHWDEIKWERSLSGNLMHSDNRYMEWNQSFSRSSEYCFQKNKNIDLEAMEEDATDFTIKFMVKNENDKGCQTDFNDSSKASNRGFVEINEEYCKRKIYDEYFKGIGEMNNQWRYINNMEDSNDNSFFSVNHMKNNTATTALRDILVSSNSSSSSICTITSSSQDALAYDPFESWRSFKVHGGIIERDFKNACMHSLWESCTTCTRNDSNQTEEKSIPANRLLKDELRMDGDEIMNVIQNLYITGDYCEDDEKDEDECEDMNHFYMDMLDDSIDGSGGAEEESKFYEVADKKKETCQKDKIFTPSIFERHQCEEILESFDDFTMAKMQWQWDKRRETEKDQEKYLKLLKWIQSSLLKENYSDSNNNFQFKNAEQQSKNRKRRHSTCQNFMENKMTSRSQDHELTYHLSLSRSPTIGSCVEETANMFNDASKMLKVNMEKILLIADSSNKTEIRHSKAGNGANYYRNILQQQHALIKQMDLARPLTR